MIGTLLNVAGILFGGLIGLTKWRPLAAAQESYVKVALAAFTVFYGLRLVWMSFSLPFAHVLKQLVVIVLALFLGRLTGKLLRLQKMSNAIGRRTRELISATRPDSPRRTSDGFTTSAALFCIAPLGILGAIQDGLSGYFYPLAVKAVIDGLATMGFVTLFGGGVLMAAAPVLAVQGTVTLACARFVEPFLSAHGLVDSVNGVGGLLVFCVALVMLQLKKIELADYLPSLVFAPLITWLW